MKNVNLREYASELLFHAQVANPWDVGETEFKAIVGLLVDGTKLTPQEQTDAWSFFNLACEMAEQSDPNARELGLIHRAACDEARKRGYKVRNVSFIP
jgi:hypothetical protein